MLTLYNSVTSVCSVKVRLGLAEMGLAYDSIVLDLLSGDQHAPAYLELNPEGVVPTLVEGDLVVLESSLILEYLDREHNGGRLMPEDRAAQAQARYWLLRCVAIHDAVNTLTFSTVMRRQILASKTPEQIAAGIAKMPNPIMGLKRKDLIENGLNSPHVGQALRVFARVFADMDRALQAHTWLSGETYGIVDVALTAYVDRLERLGFEGLWAEHYPLVTGWLAAVQQRPSYVAEALNKIPADGAARMRAQGSEIWPELRAKLG